MQSQTDVAWERYLAAKGFPLDGSHYTVLADELKQLGGREPRLMAKFDEPNQLPQPLARAGYTLLPVRNGEYILFPGNLFVPVSDCSHRQIFTSTTPFRLETAGRGQGESQYIDQAYNIGVLSDFVGVSRSELFLTIRGRERTSRFTFRLSQRLFEVDGVQIEVDAGYEAARDIVLIEAKIGARSHFNVRQLYYPFRHFRQLVPVKRVRLIFLAYDLAANHCHLYEVAFRSEEDPTSWHFPACRVYQLQTMHVSHIDDLIDVRFGTQSYVVPQADDINRIVELLDIISSGRQTAQDVADSFGFHLRQSSYYREAAEYLGLVRVQNELYMLTERGERVGAATVDDKRAMLARCIVNSWIFAELIDRARRRPSATFTLKDVDDTIASVRLRGNQRYTSSTIPRRRQTIVAWIRWLSQQFGCFEVHGPEFRLA